MLDDRHGLAREHGLVGRQIRCAEQFHIGGHAVALGQQHQVAQHQVPASDALLFPVAYHQGARTGEVA